MVSKDSLSSDPEVRDREGKLLVNVNHAMQIDTIANMFLHVWLAVLVKLTLFYTNTSVDYAEQFFELYIQDDGRSIKNEVIEAIYNRYACVL